jgi:hypothetical protein
MSVYGINKVAHLLQADPAFREQMTDDPERAIAELPLSDTERAAILGADMAALYRLGAHTFLLSRIPRFLPGLISRDDYIEKMRSTLSPEDLAGLERQSADGGQLP